MRTSISKDSDGTYSLKGLEVFRAGDYGAKGSYTEADLDDVAASYDAKSRHEAPLTIDHEQKGPAFGWVSRVFRSGASLFADLRQIPEGMIELLKSGSFKKRSVELFRTFEGTGKPYLKAVSLLGASAPHVKGMRDIEFAHAGESVSFDLDGELAFFWCDTPSSWTRPDGVSTGVLVRVASVADFLGHSHRAAVDEQGNGFTSAPEFFDTAVDRYRHLREGEPGYHQHLIVGGKMQAADDGNGNLHTHPYGGLATMSDNTPTKNPGTAGEGSNGPAPAPAPVAAHAVSVEQFNELKAANEKLRKELDEQKTAAERERQDRRFEVAFNAALESGRVTPAERPTLYAVFCALPVGGAEVAFSDAEGKKTKGDARAAFLATFAARPALNLTEPVGRTEFGGNGNADERTSKRAREIFAEQSKINPSFSMADAIIAATKEVSR